MHALLPSSRTSLLGEHNPTLHQAFWGLLGLDAHFARGVFKLYTSVALHFGILYANQRAYAATLPAQR
jgi:hypothetical protein